MKHMLQCAALVAVLAVAARRAQADLIFGSATTNATAPLTKYDTVTDTTTLLASIPGNMGLSFDSSNNLFGIENVGGSSNRLYSINTTTGVATSIGTGTYNGFVEAATFNLGGVLLAATSGSSGRMYSVNTSNGLATDLGAITGIDDVDGMTVAPVAVGAHAAGTLFAIDSGKLYTINQGTLVATLLHSGLNVFETIAFAADGTLYGNSALDYYTINVATGTTTLVGGPGAWGSAVSGSLVPEPTTLALLGLGVLAVVRKRRKKTA